MNIQFYLDVASLITGIGLGILLTFTVMFAIALTKAQKLKGK